MLRIAGVVVLGALALVSLGFAGLSVWVAISRWAEWSRERGVARLMLVVGAVRLGIAAIFGLCAIGLAGVHIKTALLPVVIVTAVALTAQTFFRFTLRSEPPPDA